MLAVVVDIPIFGRREEIPQVLRTLEVRYTVDTRNVGKVKCVWRKIQIRLC